MSAGTTRNVNSFFVKGMGSITQGGQWGYVSPLPFWEVEHFPLHMSWQLYAQGETKSIMSCPRWCPHPWLLVTSRGWGGILQRKWLLSHGKKKWHYDWLDLMAKIAKTGGLVRQRSCCMDGTMPLAAVKEVQYSNGVELGRCQVDDNITVESEQRSAV